MTKNRTIIIKTPQGSEITFEDLCYREYCKINNLMNIIENQFNISLHDYPELRHEILDISNFIKRLSTLDLEVL